MQVIAIDIMGPLPESKQRNAYIVVIADYFTKWIETLPIHNQEATTEAKKLADEVFCRIKESNLRVFS